MRKAQFLAAFLCFIGMSGPAALRAQPTDAAAYTFVAGAREYVAVPGPAEAVDVGDEDDGYYNGLTIGFPFRFCGVDYTTASASTNGFLLLGQDGTAGAPGATNDLATGGTAAGLPLLAPLWDNLSLASGSFRTGLTGTAPNRVFTAEWEDVRWGASAPLPSISFEVKLYENTNVVQFAYRNLVGGAVGPGAGASVGLAGAAGDYLSLDALTAFPVVSSGLATNDISVLPSLGNRVYSFTPARVLYDFAAKTAPYVPLTTPAAALSLGNAEDGTYNGVAIGFPFVFRGVPYATISASTNGWFTFNQDLAESGLTNDLKGYADGAAVPTVLAPLWDDLSLVGGGFRTSLTGTAPGRVFTAEWFAARWQFTALSASLSFQVKLFEGTNRVWYTYAPTVNLLDRPAASIGFNDGGYFLSLDGTGPAPTASATAATDNLAERPAAGQVYAFAPMGTLGGPLPVELVAFSAQRRGPAVALAWRTASEKNNAGFAVEKSLDGEKFRELAFVAGAGGSGPRAYSYLDAAPAAAYYRLRQQDFDGQTSYSPVQFVAAAAGSAEPLSLFPVPARGTAWVLNAAPDTPLVLFDGLGRAVRTFPAGSIPLDLAGLAPGLYRLRAGGQHLRLVVE
ncbi:hypothetical protein [Hymenobacter sp.]|uniref:hypothetical protein n=1 Tax=Hymenobacter sp. TaxID=1898978 RepID=UPI00286AADB7|nr:hypothetical protein [Hymenobacter sp.]